jgi:hypothetical protein
MSEAKRQLKIKTGSVKRLAKEVVMYKKDEQTETDRVSRMRAAGGDASDIKHAVRTMQLRSRPCCAAFGFEVVQHTAGTSLGRGSYDGP